LNSGGYYQHLILFMRQAVKEQFLYEPFEERIIVCDNPVELFNKIQ
jgi:hypothetical protein